MRLWSLHPRYLDVRGLLAAWREGLLAKKVLEGNTRGYRNHPQLIRFAASVDPLSSINLYLSGLLDESMARGYRFDGSRLSRPAGSMINRISVTSMQVQYEKELLRMKLRERDKDRYRALSGEAEIEIGGVFRMIPGDIESWERTKPGIAIREPRSGGDNIPVR
ncbi:MAG: pyrimidine dimer DNA glycosylase/endonuclease V [Spirochaetes bacterium]|nr:pyrimidine dimer DNA glycosylase/endonuclease V [Spirochaetota bacterium]MBU1082253.1 pyrimidine dimer DNA glycosylase/endonuclease V [Spirochaetota bacterium]